MATNSNANKVFVSPGIYTSELDLTFVAQSVGVTTLGMAGETLHGPAFEPILITDYNQFTSYFGTTSPEKDGIGNPKYELPYYAKSYLQESNQLFVTRVLGLTGYKTTSSYGIKTLAGVIYDPTEVPTQTGGTFYATSTGVSSSSFYSYLSGITATSGDNVPTFIVNNGPYVDGEWFTIGLVPTGSTSGLTGTQITGPNGEYTNANWYNVYYVEGTGLYSYLFVYSSGSTSFNVTEFLYSSGVTTNQYGNITVALLRSRGQYVIQTLNLEVETYNSVTLTSTNGLDMNPLAEFNINVTGLTSGPKTMTCSMDVTSSKYITKVLGVEVFDKVAKDDPIYVHEAYPTLLNNLYKQGLIRGLSLNLSYHTVGNDFLTSWDTTSSPMVVSEVRGGRVFDLFQVVTIADGETANFQVKVTIMNIDLDMGEFDLVVRDFNDTDDNMIFLEKYTRCSMNPTLPGYVALKIGTADGQYALTSSFIMLNMADNPPSDALPSGFKGYSSDNIGQEGDSTLGGIEYKTQYFNAGDETGFFDTFTGEPVLAINNESYKKFSLGLSSSIGYDSDLLKFKGVAPDKLTPGFHLSVNASTITGNTITGFAYSTTPYDFEGVNQGSLSDINYRKFTFAVAGGFDGWDIYRNVRTNSDGYIFGKKIYVSGNTNNGGVFNTKVGNSDYYAYLQAIQTYQNPEAVDINIFATPGINFNDHGSLVSQTIDMIESDRADSLYIINSPNVTTAQEIVDDLTVASIDSNYSATYWPWILVRDVDNSTQLYIPPTGEVLRNIALTDNVSYPWFAVAGYSRGLVNSIKAIKKLTLDDRDLLYKNRINPIATFSDTGTIIWGNKTLQVRESALDRINVRRLLLQSRKLISAVAVRLLFEQNDDTVRQEFLRLVNPILDSIKKERGLYDFRVTVSSDPADIDANTLRGKIYIKPTRSLEFIDLEFIITPTGASFQNI